MRWISLLSEKVNCSLAASTGIHYADAVIKQILAGADAVQVVSTLYLNGIKYLKTLHTEMDQWMIHKGIYALSHIKGKNELQSLYKPCDIRKDAVYETLQSDRLEIYLYLFKYYLQGCLIVRGCLKSQFKRHCERSEAIYFP